MHECFANHERNDVFGADSSPSETILVGGLSTQFEASKAAICNGSFTSILLKNPLLWRPHLGLVALSARQNSCLLALCGEDGRREWNELRQFSQILGSGG